MEVLEHAQRYLQPTLEYSHISRKSSVLGHKAIQGEWMRSRCLTSIPTSPEVTKCPTNWAPLSMSGCRISDRGTLSGEPSRWGLALLDPKIYLQWAPNPIARVSVLFRFFGELYTPRHVLLAFNFVLVYTGMTFIVCLHHHQYMCGWTSWGTDGLSCPSIF